jgi:hypothetical protein
MSASDGLGVVILEQMIAPAPLAFHRLRTI